MVITIKGKGEEPVKVDAAVLPETKTELAAQDSDTPDPDVVALKKQLADAEVREKTEREKRIASEKERDEANTKVASSQTNEIKAHEVSLNNAMEVATGNLNQIKRDLREAMEGGDLEKQVELQEKLADARWAYKGVEQNKKQFEDWKEQQKNAVVASQQKPKYTAGEQAWIDAHPKFNTDDDYYEAVASADSAARRRGIQPDTKAYYEYVEARLRKLGLETDDKAEDTGRDTTGSEEVVEDEPAPKQKPKLVVPAAPASYSAPTSGNNTRSKTQFKLTAEMQDMAHRMFGPGSSHKLTDKQAEEKYAAWQLDIRERRANGEKV